MRSGAWTVILAVVVAMGIGGAALAQNLPRLPDAIALAQSPDSPGKVTFLHATHLGDRPDCTRCHPKLFPIVKQRGQAAHRRITHAKMDKGGQCGACHNARTAFGRDDCSACHK